MCRAGGPRCDGRRKAARAAESQASAGTVATEPASSPTKATKKGTVPTREDTNRLAAAYPADAKGWDGKPLSDVDRRLYALRDSGWKGPIDQDGYPDVTSEGTSALRRMARDRGENPDW